MLTPQIEAALSLQQFFEPRGWKWCVIGGLAVQRWGQPRQTLDADVALLTGFGSEESYVDELLSQFQPRHQTAREFALTRRVLLAYSGSGVPIDIALSGLPFEERVIERSSLWQPAVDTTLRTCSAEDLIVYKAFAARGVDWFDIEGVLMRQGERLDIQLILREIAPLAELKEEPEIVERLRAMIKQHK